MTTGSMKLYGTAFAGIMTVLRLDQARLAAVLLDGRYVPAMDSHSRYGDIKPFELGGGTYVPQPVNGVRVEEVAGGAAFHTDTIRWPAPANLMPARYLALVFGTAGALKQTDRLFGLVDLAPGGGAVEAQRGHLSVSPGEDGWFSLTTNSNPV